MGDPRVKGMPHVPIPLSLGGCETWVFVPSRSLITVGDMLWGLEVVEASPVRPAFCLSAGGHRAT